MHRSFGSRLAQQIVRHVDYDTEHGFDLACKVTSLGISPVIRAQGYSQMPGRMLPNNSQQLTVFVSAAKDTSFGVAAAWKEHSGWKTKAWSLGKYLMETDAVAFVIDMVVKSLLSMLEETNHRHAEIATKSRPTLTVIENARHWTLPMITSIASHTQRIEDEGGRVVLTWLADDRDKGGYKTAGAAAQRAAKRQPREMRSASLSYVKQAVKERWKTTRAINKHIENAKKSAAARYLQLKFGHAITGVHLLRIGKVQDAHC
jgi:hypothetical protein